MIKLNKKLLSEGVESVISSGDTTKTDETKVFYKSILSNVQDKEVELDKYYYEFRYDEIIQMLKDWEITTVQSIKTVNTILNAYLQFYIDEGKIDIKYSTFMKTDDLMGALYSEHEEMYFTNDREFEMFIKSFCQNSQDLVIFSMLFEGINGIRSQEMRQLRIEDINFETNKIKLKQDNKDGLEEVRYIRGSSLLIESLHEAIEGTLYYKNNGQASIDNKTEYFEIESNGYILRNSGRATCSEVGQHIIQQRVKKLSNLYGKSKLSPRNIMISGMMLKLKKIESINGEVTNDDIKKIHTQYNFNPDTWFSTKKTWLSVEGSFTVTNS